MYIVVAASLITCIPVLWILIQWNILKPKLRHDVKDGRRYRNPAECRMVLDAKVLPGSLETNQLGQVAARAGPNQRLVAAFGIDNAFTTTDKDYSKAFLATARAKIAGVRSKEVHGNGWPKLALSASSLLLEETNTSPKTIRLDTLVQTVTFKIAVQWLWELDPRHMDHQAVLDATSEINLLWIASKTTPSSSNAPNRSKLDSALRSILEERSLQGRDNPLNLLIPAYETLWRVILSGVLEIVFRRHPNGSNSPDTRGWITRLATYLENPTSSATFTDADVQRPTSVEHLVKECLRLYPPTKRVNRSFSLPPGLPSRPAVILSADIEACHKDVAIWGPDAECFRPARWLHVTEEQTMAFLPFGDRPFICPAKEAFGPRMVGLLIAAFAGGCLGRSGQ